MTERVYAIRLTLEAQANIDSIFVRLWETAGDDVARAWRHGLLEDIATLATLPERCSVAVEDAFFSHGPVRQLLSPRSRRTAIYRVLFTIHDPPDDAPFVRIQHVRHSAPGPMTADEAQAMEDAG